MMYATPPAIHALPPKPVFDHFSHTHAPSPVSISPRPILEPVPAIPGFHYSFCIQLSIAPPPRREDILYASEDAEAIWLHPEGCPPEQQLPRRLPFYNKVVRKLENLCDEVRERGPGSQASIAVSESQSSLESRRPSNHSFETNRPKSDIVIGIWMAGPDSNTIIKLRSMFLGQCPVALVTTPLNYCTWHKS